jgi:hypothetical protein
VSKRSYRRLAVVAGAALAVGSMAPAMAAGLEVSDDSSVTVTVTPQVTVPDPAVPELPDLPLESAGMVAADIQAIVDAGLQNDIAGTAQASVEELLEAFSGFGDGLLAAVSLIAQADSDPGDGTVGANVHLTAVGGLVDAAPTPDELQAAVLGAATPLVDEVTGTASGAADAAVEAATDLSVSLPAELQAFVGEAGGLLGDPTDLLTGVSADVNVIASIMASL